MKSIIAFYTKAKQYESLSNFYDSCSQIEIDEYRDYEKALQAIREALKYMVRKPSALPLSYRSCIQPLIADALDSLPQVKARAQNKEEKMKYLQQRIYLVDRFVEARKIVKKEPNEMVKIAYQLLEQPDVESAVRGTIYTTSRLPRPPHCRNLLLCHTMRTSASIR
eukprot:SAG11_NODE_3158_length_2643_cov_2.460299_3_plen_166_part_00